jgi:cytoplasmic iron level regulating protein YaaA (DUF328/UPF0246 family)
MAKYLLIISCSDKKDHREGLMPAIKRYKGAWYGVINKLNREERFPLNLDVLIISAKYGLIPSDHLIEDYDWRMDVFRARELNDSVIGKLEEILENAEYESILINLGKDYTEAIRGFEEMVPHSVRVSILNGSIGTKKRDLKNWILSIR